MRKYTVVTPSGDAHIEDDGLFEKDEGEEFLVVPATKKFGLWKILSIRGALLTNFVVLSIVILIVGGICFLFFLEGSLSRAETERRISFFNLFKNVRDVMKYPVTMVNTLSATVKSNSFSFDNSNSLEGFEEYAWLTYYPLAANFDQFNVRDLLLMATNLKSDESGCEDLKAVFYYKRRNGIINTVRVFPGLYLFQDCFVSLSGDPPKNPLECIVNENKTSDWGLNMTNYVIQTISKMEGPEFIQQLLCPDPAILCDIFFCYVNPVRKNDSNTTESPVGAFTSCLSQMGLQEYLKSAKLKNNFIYIVDAHSFDLVSTSDKDDTVLIFDQGTQMKALKSENKLVRDSFQFVLDQFGQNPLETMEVDKYYQFVYSKYYVDTLHYDPGGTNWVIVVVTPLTDYLGNFIAFGVISGVIILLGSALAFCLGASVTAFISQPISRLAKSMQKAEDLQFDEIQRKFSVFSEVHNLEKKFYYLVDILVQYKAFLPSYLKGVDSFHDLELMNNNDGSSGSYQKNDTEDEEINSSIGSNSSLYTATTGQTSMTQMTGVSRNSERFRLERKKRFDRSIQIKYVSLVCIRWGADGSLLKYGRAAKNQIDVRNTEFLRRHTKLTDHIERGVRFFNGTLLSFDETQFLCGWNVFKPCNDHGIIASKFIMSLIDKCEAQYELFFGADTGEAFVSVLGSNSQKLPCVFGNLKQKVQLLSKHACKCFLAHPSYSNCIIGRKLFTHLNSRSQYTGNLDGSFNESRPEDKPFKIIPVDVIPVDYDFEPVKSYSDLQEALKTSSSFDNDTPIGFGNIRCGRKGKAKIELVYFLGKHEIARNEEWMYVKEVEEKAEEINGMHEVWDLLINRNDVITALEKMEVIKDHDVFFGIFFDRLTEYSKLKLDDTFENYLKNLAFEKIHREEESNFSLFTHKFLGQDE